MFWRESNGIVVGPSGVYNCEKCPCDPGGEVPICNSSPWPKTWDDDFESYTTPALLAPQSSNWEATPNSSYVITNTSNNAVQIVGTGGAVKPGPSTRLYFDGNLDSGISTQVQIISSSGYTTPISGFPTFSPLRRIGMLWWGRLHPDDYITGHNSDPATDYAVWLYYNFIDSQWETRVPYELTPTAVTGPAYSPTHTLKITADMQSFTYDSSTGNGEFVFDFEFFIDGVSRRTVTGNTHDHPVNVLNTNTMCTEFYGFFYDGPFTSLNGGAASLFDNWESDITPATP